MIAYNHNIVFSPSIESPDLMANTDIDTITFIQSSSLYLEEKLPFFWIFNNNQGREISIHTDRELGRSSVDQPWAFIVKDVVTFFWNNAHNTIEFIPHKLFTPHLLKYWSLHIVLPIYFTIKEQFNFLHAGAVEIDDKTVLFIAPSYGGKSTMTDFFIQQNHRMISDDKVAVSQHDQTYLAIPSHPFHRPYRNQEDLGYIVEHFAYNPMQVHAIYEIVGVDSDATVKIAQIHGIEKFRSLCNSSEINLTFHQELRFKFISQLAKNIPVYKVTVPWNLERLTEVHAKIVVHSRSIGKDKVDYT